MITKATIEDVSALNTLINSAYRGESSKKGWTTEANILEGLRTTEQELTETIQNTKNTILKFTQENQIIGCVLLIEKKQELYLGMLTVSPELQNSGIGRQNDSCQPKADCIIAVSDKNIHKGRRYCP